MRYAIFSDIHSDVEALRKVLNHAKAQQVDRYFCLGDVGIDECVALVRAVSAPTVFGNWEASGWRSLSADNQTWALQLPPLIKNETMWLTHAAPFWPKHFDTLAAWNSDRYAISPTQLFPYLHFESDALWQTIAALKEAKVSLLFHGHTHRQITWRFTADNHLQKLVRQTVTLRSDDTLVVGVGSVGRPEDGPGACYAIFDEGQGQIELFRITT
ncbi:MAG: metallophosphoesterase family protein [Anaerolineae bacterium]|nr:metallophosphoesterase family protein [Anaerolineae bacterium]